MCVAERDVGSLVAHTFRDGECRKSHVDEQAYVAVSQVVNSDSLYARSCTAALHLMSEVVLGGNEHAICRSNVGIAAEVFLNLLFDEHRDFDDPHGLRGLGVGDEVPAADSLIRCPNVHLELVEIEGAGGERQELSYAHAGPVQNLEHDERLGLLEHGFGEPQVLVFRPEVHLASFLCTHLHGFNRGIWMEAVVARGMIEDGSELVVDAS